MASPLIELNICKSLGKVVALDRVDFEIRPNEVVGLLGDNGAGKSTSVKVLSGVVFPDEGILQRGVPVEINSYSDEEKLGLETIYQDIALVNTLSVYRNTFLAREETDTECGCAGRRKT